MSDLESRAAAEGPGCTRCDNCHHARDFHGDDYPNAGCGMIGCQCSGFAALDQGLSAGAPAGTGAGTDALDLCEFAWGVIANAGGGNWERESRVWRETAARWRERYHALIGSASVSRPPGGGDVP